MLGRWDCRTCERDCEGNGYGSRESRLCRDCSGKLATDLYQKLGLGGPVSDDDGVLIDWQDVKKLVAQIQYDPTLRCTFITDKDRVKGAVDS